MWESRDMFSGKHRVVMTRDDLAWMMMMMMMGGLYRLMLLSAACVFSRCTESELSLGLAVLADSYPERILEWLLKDFQHGPSLPTSNKEHSLEARLKVGEVLIRASRAMGERHLNCFHIVCLTIT